MSVEFNNKFIVSMLEGVEKEVIAELDKVAMRAHARLVTATPVDTGQARAGWNFTLNKVSKKIPPKVKSTGSVVYPAPNSKPDAKAKTFSDSYHISNFVPHVTYLNQGSSSQNSDPKFVEREIRLAIRDVTGK